MSRYLFVNNDLKFKLNKRLLSLRQLPNRPLLITPPYGNISPVDIGYMPLAGP